MSQESFEEKTEAATPRRREEAHAEGNIPRSQELTTAVMLLGAALAFSTVGASLIAFLRGELAAMLARAGTLEITPVTTVRLLQERGGAALLSAGSFVGAMGAIALMIAGLQARGVLSSKALGPNWGRLNPIENFKRLVGLRAVGELVKSLLKLVILGWALYVAARGFWPALLALGQAPVAALGAQIAAASMKLLVWAGGSYLALGALDYAYEWLQHERRLRMSKTEIRMEFKQSEGDPMVKHRIRALARQRARQRMLSDVAKADVVIANPTHLAIALKYNPAEDAAPIVLAMGQRKLAQRIKALAYDHGVPVVENRPLARALMASAKVGQQIPAELYTAVAEILAFVLRTNETRYAAWRQR